MNDELKAVIIIAEKAGAILASYFKNDLVIEHKQDKFDPVTQADKESDEFIRKELKGLFPDDEILSEENEARPSSYEKRVWMVDPLDGTKDFIGGRASFTVMIGLLDKNVPSLGVVYNPISKELFYAVRDGGAYRHYDGKISKLSVGNAINIADATLITRNQVSGDVRPLDNQVNNLQVKARLPEGSIGLKLGRIAEGKADLFVHTNTHGCKWDTLAAEVIIKESGGVIFDLEGNNLDYTKDYVGWDKYFVAACNSKLIEEVLDKVKLPRN